MMSLLEDLRLALVDLCRVAGMSRTAAAAVPAVLLGVVLNVVALGVVNNVRTCGRLQCEKQGLESLPQSEVKMIRGATVSALKKLCVGHCGLCSAKQWVAERSVQVAHYRGEISCVWLEHLRTKGKTLSIATTLPTGIDHCTELSQA